MKTHGKAICGNAWKFEREPDDGYLLHATIIVRDGSKDFVEGMLRSACDIWQPIAGEPGYVLNCNAPDAGLEYRGWNTDEWGSSIREELDKAAVYLISTDALYRWDFGPEYPTAGFGDQLPQSLPF